MIRIYGAGMAGLLAARMLQQHRPVVYEAQGSLPDNHGALLRFRTDGVARETSIPFRRVRVLKAVKSGGRLQPTATIADTNQYSAKVTGEIVPRSVLDLEPCERFIAPDNFLAAMARDAILRMSSPLTSDAFAELENQRDVAVISTIPMNVLMQIVGWHGANFQWRPIWSHTITIEEPRTDVYQTIYYPDPDVPYYRASITGNRLIVEYAEDPAQVNTASLLGHIAKDFGLRQSKVSPFSFEAKRQEYGKLLPLPEEVRQEFVMAMTDRYNIYSVGRFATWRQILLDDVVQDVRKVEHMILQRNSYLRRLQVTV